MSLGAGTLGGGATAAAVAAAAAVCAAAAALLLAYRPQLWPAQHCRTWLSRHRGQSRKQAFVLMVTLRFEDAAHKQEFIGFWALLAAHVRAHEPGTLAFELLQSDSQPNELLVYERYIDKPYYLQVHRSSPAMATFKQCVAGAGWQPQISGQSYKELNVGFML